MALAGRGFLAWYNARLTSHPYSVKAFGTGATYVASDCSAQSIEGEKNVMVQDRAARALKFGAVGCFWVGPVWKSTSATGAIFTKSFLGDDAAVLARSSGEQPASPRHRAGVASMAWRTTRRFSTNAP